VSQSLARQCWPGQDPLGKRLTSTDESKQQFTVVGVVKDRLDWRRDKPELPTLYVPVERSTQSSPMRGLFWVRSSLTPTALRESAMHLGQGMMPPADLKFLVAIDTQLSISTAPRRVYMWLLNAMGGLGLLLSALGIYAVTAYAVARRTREIGIRMALGASRASIARLILGRGGRLILNGMILGLAAAFTLARYLESLLYQVQPGDPWVYGGVILALGAVAGMACWLPARRAMRIDPMTALRYE
ncbi:MAG: FtsX-like permease family protein, partial [Verrucomicrobia bacterium]|nr:FtsX-like permease family protein [Verrucomicrobiota bacterium]